MEEHDFGKTLKRILIERGMTQRTLASYAGMDPVTLNRYIKGERKIPLKTLKRIAQVLELEPQELFGTKDADFLTWHYGLLERQQIDIERGIAQAIEQGKDKSFIFPIIRKYYTKEEIQELLDSYGSDGGEKNVRKEESFDDKLKELTVRLNKIIEESKISKAPPSSLFEGTTTAEKKELMEKYFNYINRDEL